ncbi:MAG: hypothetical protein KGY74_10270 [Candidatus Cloacimonetes bacterium]|nr:hypothetical protein [Candidatus Cloacimonadota bacterium]
MATKKDYKIGYWKGIKKYACKLCAFDTFDLDEMKKHITNVHGSPKPKQPKEVEIKDRFGQTLTDSKGNKLYKTIK